MSLHAEPCAAGSTQGAQLLKKARAGAAAAVLSTTLGGAAIAAEAGEVQAGEGPDLPTTVLFTATIAALVILTVGVSPPCSPVSLSCPEHFQRFSPPHPCACHPRRDVHLVCPSEVLGASHVSRVLSLGRLKYSILALMNDEDCLVYRFSICLQHPSLIRGQSQRPGRSSTKHRRQGEAMSTLLLWRAEPGFGGMHCRDSLALMQGLARPLAAF